MKATTKQKFEAGHIAVQEINGDRFTVVGYEGVSFTSDELRKLMDMQGGDWFIIADGAKFGGPVVNFMDAA